MLFEPQDDGAYVRVHVNPAQVCTVTVGGTDAQPVYTVFMSNGEEYDIDRIVEWIDGQSSRLGEEVSR